MESLNPLCYDLQERNSVNMREDNISFFDINNYFTPPNKYGYLELTHDYRILVSFDEESTNKLWSCELYDENDGGINHNMRCLSFHEDTFYYMEDYIFNLLNAKLGLLINMYEEEYIETEQLDQAIDIMENIIDNTDDKAVIDFGRNILDMMKIAKEHGTIVGFCF